MSFIIRRGLFTGATVIFLILVPILSLYTLGYSYNFDSKTIEPTLSIRIETAPFSTEIYNEGNKLASFTPIDLKILKNTELLLELRKDNYISENFLVSSKETQSSSIKLSFVQMLSQETRKISNFDLSNKKFTAFVDGNLFYQDVTNQDLYLQKTEFLNQFKPTKIINQNELSLEVKPSFIIISKDIYLDTNNQVLIWSKNSNSFALDLKNSWKNTKSEKINYSTANINSIVEYNNSVIFTDSNLVLRQLDLNTLDITTIDNNIIAVSKDIDPDNIWIWNQTEIKVFNDPKSSGKLFPFVEGSETKARFSKVTFQNIVEQCLNSVQLSNSINCNLASSNMIQANVIQAGTNLFFIPNQEKLNPKLISDSALSHFVSIDTVFWLNKLGNIYAWNSINNNETYLGNVDISKSQKIKIEYEPNWKRVMIYSSDKVSSVWYDKSIENKQIIRYYPVVWIKANCNNKLQDKTMFCVEENNVTYYQNANFPSFF